ncbi:MAG TPA: hypothetical protein VGM05_03845 [Planctomycetaceae bacterium]|jgi:hypothetical protein
MRHISTLRAICCIALAAQVVSAIAFAQSPAEKTQATAGERGKSQDRQIEIEQIAQRFKNQETKVQSFRVKTSAEVRQRTGLKPDGPELTRKITTTFAVDERGRIRSTEDGGRPGLVGTAEVHEQREVAVFDGKLVRMLRGKTEFDWGYIGPDESRIPREVDPREYLLHYFHEPLSVTLTNEEYRIAGREMWLGRPVVRVESKPIVNRGDARQVRLLLDPERDWTPLFRGVWIRFGNEGDWHQYTGIETSEHTQTRDGVWLPRHGLYTSLLVNNEQAKTKQEPKIAWRYSVTFEDWELHPKFNDDDFSLEFPKGIFVQDESGSSAN